MFFRTFPLGVIFSMSENWFLVYMSLKATVTFFLRSFTKCMRISKGFYRSETCSWVESDIAELLSDNISGGNSPMLLLS